jgi:hypothetical protein
MMNIDIKKEKSQSVRILKGRVMIRIILPRMRFTQARMTAKSKAEIYHSSNSIPSMMPDCAKRYIASAVIQKWIMYFIYRK